jgi:hypothetical protein
MGALTTISAQVTSIICARTVVCTLSEALKTLADTQATSQQCHQSQKCDTEKETLRFLLDSAGILLILSYFHALCEYLSEKSKAVNSRTHRCLNKNPPNLGVSQ